jgi:hypothetical protein
MSPEAARWDHPSPGRQILLFRKPLLFPHLSSRVSRVVAILTRGQEFRLKNEFYLHAGLTIPKPARRPIFNACAAATDTNPD